MSTETSSLRRLVEQVCSQGGQCCVAARFSDGTEFFHDADAMIHPASTIKVALLVSLFRLVDEGAINLRDRLEIHNDFGSLIAYKRYSVDRDSDSDPLIYQELGRKLSVWNLAFRMVRLSSNLATNLLLEAVTPARVAQDMQSLGIGGLQLIRGMDDQAAFDQGVINRASARGLLKLAMAIQDNRAASRDACYLMRQAMFLVDHPDGLAKARGEGWGVAFKPGWITRHYHGFGMLYAPDASVNFLAVMTKGLPDHEGREAVGNFALAVRGAVRPT